VLGERYVALRFIGRGTYGIVIECFDTEQKTVCAVKLVHSHKNYYHQVFSFAFVHRRPTIMFWNDNFSSQYLNQSRIHAHNIVFGACAGGGGGRRGFFSQAQSEINILKCLVDTDGGDIYAIKLRHAFVHDGHQCMVFDLMGDNLYQVLKTTKTGSAHLCIQNVCVTMATLIHIVRVY
jgi:serine/threonine protein kinase